MRNIVIISDEEPNVKRIWNSYMASSARIEGDLLKVNFRNRIELIVEAIDPQMVADIVLSHDPSSEIVTGKLGIKSVKLIEPDDSELNTTAEFIRSLKKFISELDE